MPQQDINLRSYGPAYTQLGQQIRSVLLQVGLPPEVQQRVASMNDEDLGRFASEFDPEFRGFADEFMRADAPPFSVIPQRPEPTTPTERYNRAYGDTELSQRESGTGILAAPATMLQAARGHEPPTEPVPLGEQLRRTAFGLAASPGVAAAMPLVGAIGASRGASPEEMQAGQTFLMNAAAGAGGTLFPQVREALLDPAANDPALGAVSTLGQVAGMVPSVLGAAGAVRAGIGMAAGSKLPLAAQGGRAVQQFAGRFPQHIAQAIPGAPGVGAFAAASQVGAQRLLEDAGVKEDTPFRDLIGAGAQGLLGTAMGVIPAGLRLGAQGPIARTVAGGLTGGAIGAAGGIVQGVASNLTDRTLNVADPSFQHIVKLQTVIGAVMGAIAPMPITRVPATAARPAGGYPGAFATSFRETIATEAAGLTKKQFWKRWQQLGLPEELLKLSPEAEALLFKGKTSELVDVDAVTAAINKRLEQLPLAKGQAIVSEGRITWQPDDPVMAAADIPLYRMAAIADGADELRAAGRNIPIDSNVRWKLHQYAREAGVPSPVAAEDVIGNLRLKAAAVRFERQLTQIIPVRMALETFKKFLTSTGVDAQAFRRWTGMNTALAAVKKNVDTHKLLSRFGVFWNNTEVRVTTPNSQFRDVGFVPTDWWTSRLNLLRRKAQVSPGEQIELDHLEKLQRGNLGRWQPWHVRMFDPLQLNDPTGAIVGLPSRMPKEMPAPELGEYLLRKQGQIRTLQASYEADPTPQNRSALQTELTAVYGGRRSKSIVPDPDEWAFYSYSRAVMSGVEGGKSHLYLKRDAQFEPALQRLFKEHGQTPPTPDDIIIVPKGHPDVDPGEYVRFEITQQMRKDLGVGFLGPLAGMAETQAPAALAAVALSLADGEIDEKDGGLIMAGMALPRLSGKSLQALMPNHGATGSLISGPLIGAAIGKLMEDGENPGHAVMWGALAGGSAAVIGNALRRMPVRNDPLMRKMLDLHRDHEAVSGTLQSNRLRVERWMETNEAPLVRGTGTDWFKRVVNNTAKIMREARSGWETRGPTGGISSFGRLKDLGEVGMPAYHLFTRYMRQMGDTAHEVQESVGRVYRSLDAPGEWKLFDDYLQVRTRIKMMESDPINLEQPDIMVVSAREGAGLEAPPDVVPSALVRYFEEVQALVDGTPNVRQAVDTFEEVMTRFHGDMVQRGLLSQADADKGVFFPMYRLYAENPDMLAEVPGMGPYSVALKNSLPYMQGPQGPTLHGFIEVLPKYFGEVLTQIKRADLVNDLEQAYMPQRFITQHGQEAVTNLEYVPYNWHPKQTTAQPFSRVPAKQIALPKVVQSHLHYHLSGLERAVAAYPQALRSINRATAATKGWIIRGSLGVFYLNNFIGDTLTNFAFTPAGEWASLVNQYWQAAVPGARTAQTSQLLQAANQQSIGLGGAAAEMSTKLYQDPRVYVATLKQGQKASLRLQQGAVEGIVGLTHNIDIFREAQEGLGRRAAFLQLTQGQRGVKGIAGRGQTAPGRLSPKQAALKADERLVSYANTSEFFRAAIKNGIFPFGTWYFKQMRNRIPFLFKDPVTGSRLDHTSDALGAMGKGLVGATAAALWNEFMFPEVEANLADWLKATPHLVLPGTSTNDYTVISFPFPGTAVADAVGLGGFAERAVDLLSGKTTIDEQLGESANQAWQMWTGLTTPFVTVPISAAIGTDIRTRTPITRPEKPPLEKAADYMKYVISALPPMSTYARATREGLNPEETMTAFFKRGLVGSIFQSVNLPQAKLRTVHRQFMQAIADGIEDLNKDRYEATQAPGLLALAPAPGGGQQVYPTEELLTTMGPRMASYFYNVAADDWKQLAPLGVRSYQQAQGFLGGINRITNKLAHEAGGSAAHPDGGSWDETWRIVQMGQQRPPAAIAPEFAERMQRRATTVFRR